MSAYATWHNSDQMGLWHYRADCLKGGAKAAPALPAMALVLVLAAGFAGGVHAAAPASAVAAAPAVITCPLHKYAGVVCRKTPKHFCAWMEGTGEWMLFNSECAPCQLGAGPIYALPSARSPCPPKGASLDAPAAAADGALPGSLPAAAAAVGADGTDPATAGPAAVACPLHKYAGTACRSTRTKFCAKEADGSWAVFNSECAACQSRAGPIYALLTANSPCPQEGASLDAPVADVNAALPGSAVPAGRPVAGPAAARPVAITCQHNAYAGTICRSIGKKFCAKNTDGSWAVFNSKCAACKLAVDTIYALPSAHSPCPPVGASLEAPAANVNAAPPGSTAPAANPTGPAAAARAAAARPCDKYVGVACKSTPKHYCARKPDGGWAMFSSECAACQARASPIYALPTGRSPCPPNGASLGARTVTAVGAGAALPGSAAPVSHPASPAAAAPAAAARPCDKYAGVACKTNPKHYFCAWMEGSGEWAVFDSECAACQSRAGPIFALPSATSPCPPVGASIEAPEACPAPGAAAE